MVTRTALLYLARQEGLKDFAARFSPFKKMTTRFVAGEDIEEAVAAIRGVNAHGCTASFDHLNESVASAAETDEEVREYLSILQQIDQTAIRSTFRSNLRNLALRFIPSWLIGTLASLWKRRHDEAISYV